MLNVAATHMADLLLANTKEQKYSKDVYVYGIEVFISNVLNVLAIFIISCLLSDVVMGLVFLLVFCPLRVFTGGYHAKTYGKCFMVGNISFLMVYGLNAFLWDKIPVEFVWCIFSVMSLYILDRAPIIHPLQEVNKRVQRRSHRLAKYLLGLDAIILLLLSFENRRLMGMMFWTIGLVAVFMIISRSSRQREVA